MVFRSWIPDFSMLRWASANFTKASLAAACGSRTPMTEKTSPNAVESNDSIPVRYNLNWPIVVDKCRWKCSRFYIRMKLSAIQLELYNKRPARRLQLKMYMQGGGRVGEDSGSHTQSFWPATKLTVFVVTAMAFHLMLTLAELSATYTTVSIHQRAYADGGLSAKPGCRWDTMVFNANKRELTCRWFNNNNKEPLTSVSLRKFKESPQQSLCVLHQSCKQTEIL